MVVPQPHDLHQLLDESRRADAVGWGVAKNVSHEALCYCVGVICLVIFLLVAHSC